MEEFLRVFVSFLNKENLMPAVEEGTWLTELPDEPDNVFMIRQYYGDVPKLGGKDNCIRYLQIYVRNTSNHLAAEAIDKIFYYLTHLPEYIMDLDATHWAIIDVRNTPLKHTTDERGRFLYSLSFPVKTQI